ncbi:hypothetical protein TrRE_jg5444 [Triparma retinervis]|uniref:Uncharacterized protein n=1 Tax=Triparma retinervis TaxID=2557542 RepID=A0A9W7CE46_9STRA|nr:hypothetical protein TrRE_jg5444 [Triparma retinervis]
MSRLTDYSKFDKLCLDSDSDSNDDGPNPSLPPNQDLSVDAIFTSAANLFSSKEPKLALQTYHKFLGELKNPDKPVGGGQPKQPHPSTETSWNPPHYPSSIPVSPEQLLYLYVNMSAIYYSLSDFGGMLRFAASAVSVIRSHPPMMRKGGSASTLTLDVILLRTKAFFFAGKANLCTVEGSLVPIQNSRPLLLRAKASFKSAEER